MSARLLIFITLLLNESEGFFDQVFIEVAPRNLHLYRDFSSLQLRDLEGSLRYETLSHLRRVSKLKIFRNRLTGLERGAACSPPNLQSLELNFAGNPRAPVLTKEVFQQCHLQLREVFLRFDFDHPSVVEDNALEELNLTTLGLQCYRIGVLKKNFLVLKTVGLTRLILSNCFIRGIDTDVFDEMSNLEELEISYNPELVHLPEDLFLNTPKLKKLSLKHNRIRELEWDEFDGLSELEELNLTGNRLAFFDAGKISLAFPQLQKLEMLKNVWPCKLKEVFAEELVAKTNHSIDVIYTTSGCREF